MIDTDDYDPEMDDEFEARRFELQKALAKAEADLKTARAAYWSWSSPENSAAVRRERFRWNEAKAALTALNEEWMGTYGLATIG